MSTTATTTSLPTGRWAIDPVHSSASFRVKHMGTTSFRAGFGDITGSVDGDTGRIEGTVHTDSVDIRQADLRGHVLADDFLAADKNPTITFVSTSVEEGQDGKLAVKG